MPLYMRLWYESKDGRDLPQNISDWPAVVGAPPVKAAKADVRKDEDQAKVNEPMRVEVKTAAEEAALVADENRKGVVIPIDFDGDTYKRATVKPVKKTAKPDVSKTPVGRGKAKLFVRTLTMADSEAVLKAYKNYVVWKPDLGLYYLELPLKTGTVKIWIEDEKSLKAKAELIQTYGLKGAAFWRKGFEPTHFWQGFAKHELT